MSGPEDIGSTAGSPLSVTNWLTQRSDAETLSEMSDLAKRQLGWRG